MQAHVGGLLSTWACREWVMHQASMPCIILATQIQMHLSSMDVGRPEPCIVLTPSSHACSSELQLHIVSEQEANLACLASTSMGLLRYVCLAHTPAPVQIVCMLMSLHAYAPGHL